MVRSLVILGISFLLSLSIIIGIGNAQKMDNPLSYPQSSYQSGQIILQIEYENGTVRNLPVELNKVYPTIYGNGSRGNMSVTKDLVIIRYQLSPGGVTHYYYYDIDPPINPAVGGIVRIRMPSEIAIDLNPSTVRGEGGYISSYPAGVAPSQYNITGNQGPSTVAPSIIPTAPQPVNRAPPRGEGPEVIPGITLPEISPELYFVILFALIIGWLLVLRIARIGSILINVGGVEVILFIGTFLGWVSIFLGICLMILSIVPVLLEHSAGISSAVSSGVAQVRKGRNKEGGEE